MTLLHALFVHVDMFPALHTFGLSIGTNTHYLSVELVNWHPSITWETAS